MGLRVYQLGYPTLWDDEGYTATVLGYDAWRIWTETPYGNLPLHYFIVGAWTAVAGYSEFTLRFISLWFGVLLVPLTYYLAGKLFGASTRLLAALLMAMAPSFIYHSQTARPYTLLTVIYLANFLFALSLLKRPDSWWRWLGLLATTVLASYTHFFGMILPVLVLMLFLPFVRKDRHFLWGLIGTEIGTLLLAIPWLLTQLGGNAGYASGYMISGFSNVASIPIARIVQIILGFFVQIGYSGEINLASIWAVLALAVICAGLVLLWRCHTGSVQYILLVYLVVPLVAGLVVSIVFTFFNTRYLLYLAPLCFALIASISAWPQARRRWVASALIVGLPLLWIPIIGDYHQNRGAEDLRTLAGRILAESRPGDTIVVNSAWRDTVLDYYLRGSNTPRHLIPLEVPMADKALRAQLSSITNEHERVWFVFFGASPNNPAAAIRPILSEQFARVSDQKYGTTELALYDKSDEQSGVSGLAAFEDKLDMKIGSLQWPQEGEPLDSVVLSLDWRTRQTLREDYATSLRLEDENGLIWAQSDGQPRDNHMRTSTSLAGEVWREFRGLRVPAGTPPGTYSVALTVYNAKTGQPLNPSGQQYPKKDRAVILGTIHVGVPDQQLQPVSLPVTPKMHAVFGEQLALLGKKWGRDQTAGFPMRLQLYWQSIDRMPSDYQISLKLQDHVGNTAGEVILPISRADYPTSLWPIGSLVKGNYLLPITPSSPAGEYKLILSVVDSRTGTIIETPDGGSYVLGNVQVKARTVSSSGPPMKTPVDTKFDKNISLLGYTIQPEPKEATPGKPLSVSQDPMNVTLYWTLRSDANTVQAGFPDSYTVFVQLLDKQGKLVSQHDGIPGGGQLPTTAWIGNDVVVDTHTISLPTDTQKGPFTLIVGLYNSETMQRLMTSKGTDNKKLTELVIGGQ
jgi:hypothetical protein